MGSVNRQNQISTPKVLRPLTGKVAQYLRCLEPLAGQKELEACMPAKACGAESQFVPARGRKPLGKALAPLLTRGPFNDKFVERANRANRTGIGPYLKAAGPGSPQFVKREYLLTPST